MFVPLATLDRAVRLVDELTELTDPDDFARVALPGLADLIGCEVLTYNEVGAAAPVAHQLSVTLTVNGPIVVGIAFNRATHEFDETERALLAVLRRPLLNALRRARVRTAAASPTRPRLALTAAERAVLDLVSEGLTNDAIARRLQVSPRTVAKHLEHVYRKVGVSSRAAAVARAGVLRPAPNA